MSVIKTDIEGVVIIEPEVFGDSRGYFLESFSQRVFECEVAPIRFVQDNRSYSRYGVVRGLHYQREPYAQSKLVSCVVGRVLDVAVDLREDSATYGKHVAVELSAENHRQLFIPKGLHTALRCLARRLCSSISATSSTIPRRSVVLRGMTHVLVLIGVCQRRI